MAETLASAHPLDGHAEAFAAVARASAGDLVIEILDPGRSVDLRLDAGGPARGAVEAVLGAALPVRPNTVTVTDDGAIAWLGPDEWLVTGHQVGEETLRPLVAGCGAAVDVTGQRVALRIGGRLARELLSAGCALDLHPRSFPAGSCAQTLLARAGVLLVALGGDSDHDGFAVHIRTSFAGYLADWLLDAALDVGSDVGPDVGPAAPAGR